MTQHRDAHRERHGGLDAAVEAAWVGFRRRLADRVAELDDGDLLVISSVAEPAPLVEVVADSGDVVLWLADEHPATLEQRRADEAAVVVVRALREQHDVVHPSFLDADGLEVDPAIALPRPEPTAHDHDEEHDDEPLEGVPSGPAHLRRMVDSALEDAFGDLQRDDDGDVPLVSGSSVVFVRVLESRAAVELYAEIVLGPEHPGRLAAELTLLNEAHPLWKFSHRGQHVVMTHEMPAMPFSGLGLRLMLRRFLGEVDPIAAELVARVGGRRFTEPAPVEDERDVVMTGLLELLHLERVRPATVAGLFDHDRLEIIRQLVRIRRGLRSCGDRDPEVVLTALRSALRHLADAEHAARAVPPAPAPPRRRSLQEQLLAPEEVLEADQALDLGWTA